MPQHATTGLSTAQLEAYHTDGYVIVPGVFSAHELEQLDQEIDRLLPEHGDASGHRPGWIMRAGTVSDVTKSVAQDARLITLIENIVKPGVAIHSTKLVAKEPHSATECHWHQDEAFYRKPADPGTFSKTRMSVWIPLQDANETNGCLWVVPGSNTWGMQPFVEVDHGQCRKKLTKEEYANQNAVPVHVDAGSVVLFSAWTWHHSKGNAADRVRRAFIISYQEATLGRTHADWRILRPAGEPVHP